MMREGSSAASDDIHQNGSAAIMSSQEAITDPNLAMNGLAQAAAPNGSHRNGKAPVSAEQPVDYGGLDREEVTRILIQALSEMGYRSAAESVSKDSGYELENNTVASFRAAVLAGTWSEAEELLQQAKTSRVVEVDSKKGLILVPGSDINLMRFWIRQQKFLELLEVRDKSQALTVLRSEITPVCPDTAKLHFLSGLLMCRSVNDLMVRAGWDGRLGTSRDLLVKNLSCCVSPSVMLSEHRLVTLLGQVKQSQINICLYHTQPQDPSLYSDHSCDRRDFPSEVALELSDLLGEVWQVQFSPDGEYLAACGSRNQVLIWELPNFGVYRILSPHDGGVGNVAWSPDSSLIATCSQDNHARIWDRKSGLLVKKLNRFSEPVSGCVWARDGQSIVIGTLDKAHSLVTFHLEDNKYVEWGKKHRVQDICASPDGRYIVAVDDYFTVYVYNATTRELEFDMKLEVRTSSISISSDSRHLLINKAEGGAQLIDMVTRTPVRKYVGHTGGKFLIRSSLGGANESYVISGSDDGDIFIWHKHIGAVIERLSGHQPRCNAVCWNPCDSTMLASCGDDGRVRIWSNKQRSTWLRAQVSEASNGWRHTGEEA